MSCGRAATLALLLAGSASAQAPPAAPERAVSFEAELALGPGLDYVFDAPLVGGAARFGAGVRLRSMALHAFFDGLVGRDTYGLNGYHLHFGADAAWRSGRFRVGGGVEGGAQGYKRVTASSDQATLIWPSLGLFAFGAVDAVQFNPGRSIFFALRFGAGGLLATDSSAIFSSTAEIGVRL